MAIPTSDGHKPVQSAKRTYIKQREQRVVYGMGILEWGVGGS